MGRIARAIATIAMRVSAGLGLRHLGVRAIALLVAVSALLVPTLVQASEPLSPNLLARYVKSYVPTEQKIEIAKRERLCLAQAIYHEARGEPEEGQWAVAQVIVNRMHHRRYPGTICGVVYQNADQLHRCQFSFACDGKSDSGGNGNKLTRQAWVKANLIASEAYKRAVTGSALDELPPSVLFYHASSVSPSWASAYRPVAKIGEHVFYAGL